MAKIFDNPILKALLDVIRTLPPYYRAVLLMGFIFLLMFVALLKTDPNHAYFALILTFLLFMPAVWRPPPPDAVLASGQEEQVKRILRNKRQRPPGTE